MKVRDQAVRVNKNRAELTNQENRQGSKPSTQYAKNRNKKNASEISEEICKIIIKIHTTLFHFVSVFST